MMESIMEDEKLLLAIGLGCFVTSMFVLLMIINGNVERLVPILEWISIGMVVGIISLVYSLTHKSKTTMRETTGNQVNILE